SKAVAEAKRYDGQELSPATRRALMKLRLNVAAPAPDDAAKRARLTQLEAQLEAKYGEGKYCPKGPGSCMNLDQLSEILARSRNYAELTDAWKGWHAVGAGMREEYGEFVRLANEGARELGFKNLGVMWRAGYDMTPEEFDAESERLWQQVKPLYDGLHCYARARLARRYGEDQVPAGDGRSKRGLAAPEGDLAAVDHQLGHVYSVMSRSSQPFLFRDGANDGFHEAIGDTINLSVTPPYLARIGLIHAVAPSHEALINQQMKMALEKIAFLPFGRLIDEWRWKVFSGEITPANYNSSWWELRRRYQGLAPPVPRSEADFDPGAKYHIPSNTPYTRYFLSYILQFQFHKALCAAAASKAPLYECSNYGSQEAGRR